LAYLLICASFVPTAIVVLTLVSFARSRKTTLALSIIGAFFGFLFAPAQIDMGPGPSTIWQAVSPLFFPMAFWPPLGAAIFGGAVLGDDFLNRRDDPPFDQSGAPR